VLQAQLSNALASLDSATASVAEQQEIINNLQVEGTGAHAGGKFAFKKCVLNFLQATASFIFALWQHPIFPTS
jgi:hypothetical protein